MTTSSRKHYNINTLKGITDYTDEDVCQTLGLDMSVANTPYIIKAQLEKDVDPKLHPRELSKLKKYLSKDEFKQLMK